VRDPADRNAVAAGAVERLKKAEPAAFMSKAAAKLVEVGNIDDDLGRVAECDWVIEAIVEKIELKHALYEKLEGVRRPGTAVSSNTSTIPLDRLIEGRSDAFARDFLITHFFNPPRYMRLLEIVAGPKSDPALVAAVSDFADRAMGKTVVRAKDTPGFLANRVGTYWLQAAINAAFELGVSVEDADAIGGKPMGVPKTGIFGLVDLVGIDLMPYLKASLTSTLPANDPYQAIAYDHPLILKMIADGYTGRKGKGGFYRINREAGKVKEAIDLATGDYAKAKKPVSIPRRRRRICAR
jgi:3-hydroxyacyl-CoA dehydrogenase